MWVLAAKLYGKVRSKLDEAPGNECAAADHDESAGPPEPPAVAEAAQAEGPAVAAAKRLPCPAAAELPVDFTPLHRQLRDGRPRGPQLRHLGERLRLTGFLPAGGVEDAGAAAARNSSKAVNRSWSTEALVGGRRSGEGGGRSGSPTCSLVDEHQSVDHRSYKSCSSGASSWRTESTVSGPTAADTHSSHREGGRQSSEEAVAAVVEEMEEADVDIGGLAPDLLAPSTSSRLGRVDEVQAANTGVPQGWRRAVSAEDSYLESAGAQWVRSQSEPTALLVLEAAVKAVTAGSSQVHASGSVAPPPSECSLPENEHRRLRHLTKRVSELDTRDSCYPFPHDVKLCFGGGQYVKVACHRPPKTSAQEAEPGRTVLIMLPGVHGGVGPCRADGAEFDAQALFPMLASRLSSERNIVCYRVSWMRQGPSMHEAVAGVLALARRVLRRRKRRVLLIGHSLGGAVALLAAETLRRSFQSQPEIWPPGAVVAGVCTLAAQLGGAKYVVGVLEGVPKLFYHGTADRVVSCEAARELHRRAAHPSQLEMLQGCGHDLLTCKGQLLDDICTWVGTCLDSAGAQVHDQLPEEQEEQEEELEECRPLGGAGGE